MHLLYQNTGAPEHLMQTTNLFADLSKLVTLHRG